MLKSFFQFLIHPEIKENDGVFTWKHLRMIIRVFFVLYVAQAIFLGIIKMVDNDLFSRIIVLRKSVFTGENYVHPIYLAILGPIFEEVQFRLPMDLKRNSICLGLAIFLGDFLMLSFNISLFNAEFQVLPLLQYLFAYVLLFGVFTQIYKLYLHKWQFDVPNYVVVYFLSILFALMHLFNYVPLETNLKLEYILIIFGHFISACFLGYLRCHFGFWYGVLLHVMTNSMAVVI